MPRFPPRNHDCFTGIDADPDADAADADPADPAAAPSVRVVDVAGRPRRTFVRGESVVVHISLPGETRAALAVRAPDGRILAESVLTLPADGPGAHRASVPLDVPRLAAHGRHAITARGHLGQQADAVLEVASPEFPPVSQLVIDAISIYGGEDLRGPRTSVLRRGETVRMDARVGGARGPVTVTVRLSGHLGVVLEQALARVDPGARGPTGRAISSGTWRVPERILPGRYQLQLEATEGDHVSLRARDILIR